MNTIITFIDFSDVTPKLMEQTEQFAMAFNSRVILLHVVPPPSTPLVMEMGFVAQDDVIEQDYKRLTALAKLLTNSGINTRAEQMVDADIASVVSFCDQWRPDFAIVGSHHRNVFQRLFLGSFGNDVLKTAPWPVLVVPAPPTPESEPLPVGDLSATPAAS